MLLERVAKLDSIWFTWGTTQYARLEIMFEKLRKFKDREGHCSVPLSYSDNPEVSRCVNYHREKRIKNIKGRSFQT